MGGNEYRGLLELRSAVAEAGPGGKKHSFVAEVRGGILATSGFSGDRGRGKGKGIPTSPGVPTVATIPLTPCTHRHTLWPQSMGNWIKLRLAEDEQQEWQQAARAVGLGLSEYVRQAVRAQTGGRTRPEIPAEARAVKKETAVEKEKPKRVLPAPRPTSDHTKTIAALKKIHGIKTAAELPAPPQTDRPVGSVPQPNVEHLATENSAVTIRGTPLKEKNSRAMLSLLGIPQGDARNDSGNADHPHRAQAEVQSGEVIEPEVLPPQPDPPEVPTAESQQVAVRKRPAPPVKPATVGDDSGPTATRDWGDVLPIGNPRAKAAEEEREELRRRRLM